MQQPYLSEEKLVELRTYCQACAQEKDQAWRAAMGDPTRSLHDAQCVERQVFQVRATRNEMELMIRALPHIDELIAAIGWLEGENEHLKAIISGQLSDYREMKRVAAEKESG